MSHILSKNTRQSIIDAATTLFSKHGYRGASVREICANAGASANAITYHFGSKEQLYLEILDRFNALQLSHAEAALSAEPRSRQEFEIRIELFFEQLLDVYLTNRETLLIIFREFERLLPDEDNSRIGEMAKTNFAVSKYIKRAIDLGFVADDVDPDIVTGILLDRLINQAHFAHTHQNFFNVTTYDPEYRTYWVRATLRVIFNGI